ncbi:MAG: sterol desaturase family protein [Chryseotalea sp.]
MDLNPIVLSIPIFFILIGIELVVDRITHKNLYQFPDAVANLSCGITSQLSGLFLKVVAVGIYQLVYEHAAIFVLEKNALYWISLVLLVDLAYYWAHRMSHEINLFWGGHVVHHQSEEYNLSVALRQSSLQVVWTFAFNLPLALIGFDTLDFVLISSLNTLYQFWIHTETIQKLPKWIEFIFNTPSHHRVHHGRNPQYIDKNHAGALIIWDRMFGTFEEEKERPVYGITKPLQSWNPVFANVSHYADMASDIKRIPNWKDKFIYLFKKPGWLPAYLGGQRTVPEVQPDTYQKYTTPAPVNLNLYVLFQFVVALIGTALFLFNEKNFELIDKAWIALLITFTVVNCGVLFENKKWAVHAEWLRIVLYPVLLVSCVYLFQLNIVLYGVAFAFFLISSLWFYSITKK